MSVPVPHSPLKLIRRIRESHPLAVRIYTEGGCFRFHMILKAIYGEMAQPWWDGSDHVVTKIGRGFYDITGRVKPTRNLRPMTPAEIRAARRWRPLRADVAGRDRPVSALEGAL